MVNSELRKPWHHVREINSLHKNKIIKPIGEENINKNYDADIINFDAITDIKKGVTSGGLDELLDKQCFEKSMNEKMKDNHNGILILIDVLEFHKINSTFGISVGDRILNVIGTYIKRHSDFALVGYMGGNTFAFYNDSVNFNCEIKTLIEEHFENVKNHLNTTIPLKATTLVMMTNIMDGQFSELYKLADNAIKSMKYEKKQFLYFDREYYNEYISKQKRANYVNNSVFKNRFSVMYQEKTNSINKEVIGLEALARLEYDNNSISPAEFIPIFEGSGLIVEFGYNIIKLVFMDMTKIMSIYGPDVIVSINISPIQLSSERFVEKFIMLLNEHKVNPSRIELEITESVFIDNVEDIRHIIDELKDAGIRIAIDDFGTGFSALKYISDFPIDTLKIDKVFIDKINDNKYQAIIKSIIDLANALSLDVVAEGVEEQEQVEVLKKIGCNIIQGYIYSRPKFLPNICLVNN